MSTQRKIRLRSTYATADEAKASATIRPGMKIQIGSDGRAAPNATANLSVNPCRIATEDMLVNQQKTIDDSYAADDVVSYEYPLPGDHYNILMATGNSATLGTSGLAPDAAGGYVVSATPANCEFLAGETLNNTSGGYQLIRGVKL
jgi:hypothetical protein